MRQKFNFHQHSANQSLYKKGVHSLGIKVFNSLPQSLKKNKKNNNIKQFKTALEHYLIIILSNLKQRWNITYFLIPSTP
jgi:hypothetical protein